MKITHFFEVEINETARGSLKDKGQYFNKIIEHFGTKKDVKDFLIARYGKLPPGKKKIYCDLEGDRVTIGFLHSFWNQDISHNSKKWYQTDWIIVKEITQTTEPVFFDKNS